MKYKVGDKVKVRKDFKTCDTYGGYYVTDNMHKLAGKTVTISDVYECKYAICEDDKRYCWTDEMFEPSADEYLTLVWKREEPKEMTLEEVEKELGYPIKIVKGE